MNQWYWFLWRCWRSILADTPRAADTIHKVPYEAGWTQRGPTGGRQNRKKKKRLRTDTIWLGQIPFRPRGPLVGAAMPPLWQHRPLLQFKPGESDLTCLNQDTTPLGPLLHICHSSCLQKHRTWLSVWTVSSARRNATRRGRAVDTASGTSLRSHG